MISSLLLGCGFACGALVPDRGFSGPLDAQERPSANLAVAGRSVPVNQSNALSIISEIERSADGLFYVNGRVNGKVIRFVIDSGASVVVLTKADAAALSLSPTGPQSQMIQTAGGSSPMRWTSLSSVTIAGQTLTDVDAAVMDKGLQTSLLGQNILSRLGTITQEGTNLRFYQP